VRSLFRNLAFAVLGSVLLCLPATAWAEPLDAATHQITDQRVRPFGTPTKTEPLVEATEAPYLSRDVVTAGKELLVSIGQSSGIKLVPGGMYEILLDETSLGSYPADPNGQLFVQVPIPPTTPSGIHTLKATDNLSTNLQKTINIHP
jgi:hypothetical protein